MPASVPRNRIEAWTGGRHVTLLAALVLITVIYPAMQGRYIGQLALDGFLTLVLFTSVYAVRRQRWAFAAAAAIAALALVLVWLTFAYEQRGMATPNWMLAMRALCLMAIFGLTAYRILLDVLSDEPITVDKLCGAISVYFLMGVIFALLYALLFVLDPESFELDRFEAAIGRSLQPNQDDHSVFTYYSFVTLTTLGYGDVTPISGAARTFSWLEALFGQLYLAVLLARMVGLQISQSYRSA